MKLNDLNINNVLLQLAVLKALKNLDFLKIKNKLKNFDLNRGRGKKYLLLDIKKFKLIDESYNANPLSVKMQLTS